ncbi:MAG TPA: carbohydrate kinase family protein [Nocardioidaceae bacterium]|nr:carbohydrate kinase family protein [Nocardioidaceae bacterium]
MACLGDIMLDVIVDVSDGLVPDDDTPAHITFAAGGQAANVAGWVQEYGAQARLFGPRAAQGPGQYVDEALEAAGIEVHGPVTGRAGTVVSVVSHGARSLASDPGTSAWLDEVAPGPWLEGADWLFVSGYALFRAPHPEVLVDLAASARAAGTQVAVDLSSAALIHAYGPSRFRALWQALRPAVVLANELEWAATQGPGAPDREPVPGFGTGGTTVLVLKQGAKGCSFVIDGVEDHRLPVPGPVVDATGAGDALAAGYLVGGPEIAMEAAARCVARAGAQPSTMLPDSP